MKIEDLISISTNADGNFYFIFKIDNVRNTINVKAKPRNEILTVGVPKKRLKEFLKKLIK